MFEKEDLKLLEKIKDGAIVSEAEIRRLEKYRCLGYIKTGMTYVTGQQKVAALNFYRICQKMTFSEKMRIILNGRKIALLGIIGARINGAKKTSEQEEVDALNFQHDFQKASFFKRMRLVLRLT